MAEMRTRIRTSESSPRTEARAAGSLEGNASSGPAAILSDSNASLGFSSFQGSEGNAPQGYAQQEVASQAQALDEPIVDVLGRRHSYTNLETKQHSDFVEELYLRGVSTNAIVKLCKQRFGKGFGTQRVTKLRDRIEKAWREEDERQRPAWKASAIRRLHQHIRQAREAAAWTSVIQAEMLLSKIQGTQDSIKLDVNVTVTQALTQVITDMSASDMQALLDEYKETESLALAHKKTIDTTARELPPHTPA